MLEEDLKCDFVMPIRKTPSYYYIVIPRPIIKSHKIDKLLKQKKELLANITLIIKPFNKESE